VAYVLHAIIGEVTHLRRMCPLTLSVVLLPLEPRLAVIPLLDEMVDTTEWPEPGELPALDHADLLLPGVHRWLLDASKDGLIGYIEAEYWAGIGAQHAWGWRNGERVYPVGEQADVNGLLALLGVVRNPPDDEWDTVGLGRHRHTEDWLE
jgi:hypothetical protein